MVDTETTQHEVSPGVMEHTLRLGCAIYYRRLRGGKWSKGEYLDFRTPGEFWDWVVSHTRRKARLYLYAHNLMFDWGILHGTTELPARGWERRSHILDDPPTIIRYGLPDKDAEGNPVRVRGHNGGERQGYLSSLVAIDSLNYFRASLAELGENVGKPKTKVDFATVSDLELMEYCRNDTEVLSHIMLGYIDFVSTHDLGSYQPTSPSQAFSAYRHRFLKSSILIDDNEAALTLSREGYHGGRCEAWVLGRHTGSFHLLDVNSLYPYVMSQHPYPTQLVGHYTRLTVSELSRLLDSYAAVARVDLHTETPRYPLVYGHKLVWPVGRFTAVLPTPHLAAALQAGEVVRVREVSVYEQSFLFGPYVDYFFHLRQTYKTSGNKVYSTMSKLFLNSLYGKFGQSGRKWEPIGESPLGEVRSWLDVDADTGDTYRMRSYGGLVERESREGESWNSHPSIAAHVTAWGHDYLWELIQQAGRSHVYYMDTDSLVVDDEGLEHLESKIDDNRLGMMKRELSFTTMDIHGCKDYLFGSRKKIKGIRAAAVEVKPGVYAQESWRGAKGMIAEGDVDRIVVKQITKVLRRIYDKGILGPDGRVSPLRLP